MGFEGTNLLDLDVHTVDPFPFYDWLLAEEPLFWDEANKLWAVSRYDDVIYVSKHTDLFCSGQGVVPNMSFDDWPDEAMINLDGEAHTCQRGLVNKGFTPRRIGQLEGRIQEFADELIDGFINKGKFDLVVDFARLLPMFVIGEMLGYPREKMYDILDWTDVYSHAGCGPDYITDEVNETFGKFADYHYELLEERKAKRGDDLISVWLDAELDGKKLSEDKLLFEHNILLVGGSETTRIAISVGMQKLMENQDQLAFLRDNLDDEDVVNRAIEEIIRWSCPFVRMKRTAVKDVEMHGKTIREGDQIIMLYPAATRDPRAFDDPHKFDIHRVTDKPAIAFGYGKHFCLGASLARLETRISVQALLRRLPGLMLEPGKAPVRHPSCFVRPLSSCPAVFSAR